VLILVEDDAERKNFLLDPSQKVGRRDLHEVDVGRPCGSRRSLVEVATQRNGWCPRSARSHRVVPRCDASSVDSRRCSSCESVPRELDVVRPARHQSSDCCIGKGDYGCPSGILNEPRQTIRSAHAETERPKVGSRERRGVRSEQEEVASGARRRSHDPSIECTATRRETRSSCTLLDE
jgi:hypothetical protein